MPPDHQCLDPYASWPWSGQHCRGRARGEGGQRALASAGGEAGAPAALTDASGALNLIGVAMSTMGRDEQEDVAVKPNSRRPHEEILREYERLGQEPRYAGEYLISPSLVALLKQRR